MAELVLFGRGGTGRVALVDDDDYARFSSSRWYLQSKRRNRPTETPKLYVWRQGSGRKIEMLHRLIMNAAPRQLVDHASGDTLDNRKSNLRLCTQSQNIANATSRPHTSAFKGVFYFKRDQRIKRWCARIKKDGVSIHIGMYLTELEAAHAYDSAARQHHGAFARLNFPT